MLIGALPQTPEYFWNNDNGGLGGGVDPLTLGQTV
jgi:hypothetical protein